MNIVQQNNLNERELFNRIEGPRQTVNVELPAIPEEDVIHSATNETDEIQAKSFNLAENYPLRKPKNHSEVLIVGYSDIKPIIEEKIGFKCEAVESEDDAINMLKKRIKVYKSSDQKKKFFSYILVNLDDKNIQIDRFSKNVKI